MGGIYNGILPNQKKRWNLAICDNMDRFWGYYAKWNKSNGERQIPHHLNHMWDIKKKKQNKRKKQKCKYREQNSG